MQITVTPDGMCRKQKQAGRDHSLSGQGGLHGKMAFPLGLRAKVSIFQRNQSSFEERGRSFPQLRRCVVIPQFLCPDLPSLWFR